MVNQRSAGTRPDGDVCSLSSYGSAHFKPCGVKEPKAQRQASFRRSATGPAWESCGVQSRASSRSSRSGACNASSQLQCRWTVTGRRSSSAIREPCGNLLRDPVRGIPRTISLRSCPRTVPDRKSGSSGGSTRDTPGRRQPHGQIDILSLDGVHDAIGPAHLAIEGQGDAAAGEYRLGQVTIGVPTASAS